MSVCNDLALFPMFAPGIAWHGCQLERHDLSSANLCNKGMPNVKHMLSVTITEKQTLSDEFTGAVVKQLERRPH